MNDGNVTNTLASLNKNRSKWTEEFPPMLVKLDNPPAAICTGQHLVVVEHMETRVHVMDTTSQEWFSVSSLPEQLVHPSLAVSKTELYVLSYVGSVFSCSLPTLLQSSSAVQPKTTEVWQKLASVPVEDSTLTTLNGQPVAVGGHKVDFEPIETIHINPSVDSWHIIRRMPTAQYNCLVATLPGDTLVVIGGFTRGRSPCDIVEVTYAV